MAALRLLGIAEIAERYGVPLGTVYAWRHRGKLPEPDAVLAMGPIWEEASLAAWEPQDGRRKRLSSASRPSSSTR